MALCKSIFFKGYLNLNYFKRSKYFKLVFWANSLGVLRCSGGRRSCSCQLPPCPGSLTLMSWLAERWRLVRKVRIYKAMLQVWRAVEAWSGAEEERVQEVPQLVARVKLMRRSDLCIIIWLVLFINQFSIFVFVNVLYYNCDNSEVYINLQMSVHLVTVHSGH